MCLRCVLCRGKKSLTFAGTGARSHWLRSGAIWGRASTVPGPLFAQANRVISGQVPHSIRSGFGPDRPISNVACDHHPTPLQALGETPGAPLLFGRGKVFGPV